MTRAKRLLCLALALCFVLTAAGCTETQQQETAAAALSLRIALDDAPATLDPAMVTTDTEKTIVGHVFENLMKLTPEGVAPAQCKSYECVDNLDGTETYTFTLRDSAKWSDGKNVTAFDYVYSWQRLVDGAYGSPNAALLNMVSGYEEAAAGNPSALEVSAADSATLVVHLNCHCPYFLSGICTAAATCPVRSEVAVQEGWGQNRSDLLTNGPFTVAMWTGSQLLLQKNEDYYDAKRISVEALSFRCNVTADDAMAQFEAGEVDAVMDSGPVEGAALSYLPKTGVLLVNQMAGSLRRQALRQAMSLVADRNALAKLMGESCIAAQGLVSPGTSATQEGTFRQYSGSVIDNLPENYAANCQTAQQKLEAAGITADMIENLGVVSLLYEAQYEPVARALQQVWQDALGLHVTLRSASADAMRDALEQGVFTIALTELTSDRNDALGFLGRFSGGGSGNYGMYYSNAYDMLMRCAAAAKSAEARDAYLMDAERLLLESGFVIPLWSDTHYWLVRSGLTGALDNGQDTHYFTYVRAVPAT